MESTLSTKQVYAGRAVQLEVQQVALPDGRTSQREIVRHPGAVVVLAERTDGQFVFVRQFRKAIEMDLLETVAGTLDPGEDPATCAERELREETGYEAVSMRALGRICPAPGYSSEWLHIFHATTGDTPGQQDPDDDEHIEVVLLRREALADLVATGSLCDAKTLAAWLLFTQRAP